MLTFERIRHLLAASVVFGAAVGVVHSSPGHARVPQDPHRAFYTLVLGAAKGVTHVVAATGAMTTEWDRGCDGWTATQKLAVTIEGQEGPVTTSLVVASIFETHDGTKLRFTSKTTVDDETVENVRGRAERPSAGAPGRAHYLEPNGLTVELPAGTLFPYQHTLAIIDAATNGSGRDFSPFFDGVQPENSPLDVSSLVLGPARSGDAGPGAGLGSLTDHDWWPVRLAFFSRRGVASEPEIEMTQYVQANGVVRRFDFDYGDFTIVATLERIEPLTPPVCN